VKARDKRK
jgi:hypothetical protein